MVEQQTFNLSGSRFEPEAAHKIEIVGGTL